MAEFLGLLNSMIEENKLPEKIALTLKAFYPSYLEAAAQNGFSANTLDPLMQHLVQFAAQQLATPFSFEPFHPAIRAPIDYYQFGIDFIRPIINLKQSKLHRRDIVERIARQIEQGDNVILLANHQTEPDPQIMSILLQDRFPKLAEEMIFVAGHRVITDPLAVPFSKGRNLLCIYSKKYIENPPEQKPEKQAHNQKTMRKMSQLLDEGGKCIYVAPSGGRDRPNQKGVVEVAYFDANSVEMFWLMAQQAQKITHFYPLALATYFVLPPPNTIQKELGETRHAISTPVSISFGEELDMENLGQEEPIDKRHRRKLRADYIWNKVREDYIKMIKG